MSFGGMKQIDKVTQRKLNWLLLPCGIALLIVLSDLFFDMNILPMSWIKPILLGSFSFYFVGFNVVAIRQKCWGSLICIWMLTIIMVLNMTDILVKLIFGEENY